MGRSVDDGNSEGQDGGRRCKGYCCSKYLIELMGYTLVGLVLAGIPFTFPIHMRPIPYQVTGAGDVILDFSLDNPKVAQTFPEMEAGIYTAVIPCVIQILVGVFAKRKPMHAHYTWCAYSMAFGSTLCITEALKRYVGRLRPNTYDYCGFDTETLECTQLDDLGYRKSFPSGHSSTAFCGCTLLTWYLWYSLNQPFSNTPARKLLAFIALSPMLLAYVIAASRLVDNFHFVGDVVGGSVIVFVTAVMISRIHFPDLYVSKLTKLATKNDLDVV